VDKTDDYITSLMGRIYYHNHIDDEAKNHQNSIIANPKKMLITYHLDSSITPKENIMRQLLSLTKLLKKSQFFQKHTMHEVWLTIK
jgi:hypothetical protein